MQNMIKLMMFLCRSTTAHHHLAPWLTSQCKNLVSINLSLFIFIIHIVFIIRHDQCTQHDDHPGQLGCVSWGDPRMSPGSLHHSGGCGSSWFGEMLRCRFTRSIWVFINHLGTRSPRAHWVPTSSWLLSCNCICICI